MKVGMVCPYDWSYPGGVRSHIVGLVGALRRRGIEVEIIAPATDREPDIFAAGRTVGIPYNGSVARLCLSPRANSLIKRRLEQGDLDLVHIHEPFSPSVSVLTLTNARIPAVATFHASADRSIAYQVAKPLLRPLAGKIAVRIAVSGAAERLVGSYFPGEFRRIPNGIEQKRFAEAVPAELGDKPFVLFVGRPERRKGLDVAVEAVARVRKHLDVDLVAVGPTPADVPEWVRALGKVDQSELPRIYRAARVFCAPSLEGESFGIVLVEAAAAGTPVVCSDLAGYQEAAAGAALHVPVGDVGATADALLSVLQDPALAERLVVRGHRRAAALDWDALVDDVTGCYRSAVS
ncbi:MAG: glycosyltransferase family 4 protein [Actinomycetota bacterium]